MINKKTVLVLGAGASMDYGFPSGEGLIQDIVNILKGNRLYDNENILRAFVAYVTCYYVEYKKIASDLYTENNENYYKIVRLLVDSFQDRLIRSNAASIDDFLNSNKGKGAVELEIIGKILIVLSISMYEIEEQLFYGDDERIDERHRYWKSRFYNQSHCVSLNKGWYNNLWTNIYEEDNIAENLKNLTIISYNYDRSFEQYIFNSIRSMRALTTENTASLILDNLVVHHVYGQLGKLPWQSGKDEPVHDYQQFSVKNVFAAMREYERSDGPLFSDAHSSFDCLNPLLKHNTKPLIDMNNFCDVVAMIRTYHEASSKVLYKHIQKSLQEAKMLFFLGFGYHQKNIDWLGQKTLNSNNDLRYAGTIYGKGTFLINQIRVRLSNAHFAAEEPTRQRL